MMRSQQLTTKVVSQSMFMWLNIGKGFQFYSICKDGATSNNLTSFLNCVESCWLWGFKWLWCCQQIGLFGMNMVTTFQSHVKSSFTTQLMQNCSICFWGALHSTLYKLCCSNLNGLNLVLKNWILAFIYLWLFFSKL